MSSLDGVIEVISLARPTLNALGSVWDNQRAEMSIVEERLGKLRRIREHGPEPSTPADGFRIGHSSPGAKETGAFWQLEKGLPTPAREVDVLFFSVQERTA